MSGNYAYVTCYVATKLVIVDITNKASPSIVGSVGTSSTMNNVRASPAPPPRSIRLACFSRRACEALGDVRVAHRALLAPAPRHTPPRRAPRGLTRARVRIDRRASSPKVSM